MSTVQPPVPPAAEAPSNLTADTHDVVNALEVDLDSPAARPRGTCAALTRGTGLLGLLLVAGVTLLGLLAPVLTQVDPLQQFPDASLTPPSSAHWFGTDEVNRDLFARTLYGIRTDLLVVFLTVPVGAVAGTLIGLVTSWWRWSDVLAQRFFDVVLAFPTLILAIGLAAWFGPGLWTVFVVIVVAELPVFGRLIRTAVRTTRETAYVESAQLSGASTWWVLRQHVLPNSADALAVQVTLSMSIAVFIEGAMSFLGLGVRPPEPSLGSLVRDGVRTMYDAPWFSVAPLTFIVLLVLGLLLISQALSKARRV